MTDDVTDKNNDSELVSGRLRTYHANYYYVDVDGELYECFLKGVLKKALKAQEADIYVGDWVYLNNVDSNAKTAFIASIGERQNKITRPKVSNVDQVVVVHPIVNPEFDFYQADKYLMHARLAGIPTLLCVTKSDLTDETTVFNQIKETYDAIGIPVVITSIYDDTSLAQLRELLKGKTSVLAGPSGAGKSSLLNAIQPELDLKVAEVSGKIGRGQHTTRNVSLIPLSHIDNDTFVTDTPGFSHLTFNYVLPADLESAFNDFDAYRSECDFSDCLHADDTPEEQCGVKQQLDNGIAAQRYQNYLSMLKEAFEYKETLAQSSNKRNEGFKKLDQKGAKALQILKLNERARDTSRKTKRQKMSQYLGDVGTATEFDDE